MNEWPQQFFTQRYLDLFMTRTPAQLAHESEVIADAVGLRPGQTVADFCCGDGAVLEGLAALGAVGAGVDNSECYVQRAKDLRPSLDVHEGDACSHSFGRQFDVVYNWYSSYGYFDDGANQALLENMFRHTAPGGSVVLEMYNSFNVVRNFTEILEYDKVWRDVPVKVTRHSRLDLLTKKLHQTWAFEDKFGVQSHETSSTLYFADELVAQLERAGYRDLRVYQTPVIQAPAFCSLTLDSPRVMVVGRR